MPQQQHGAGAPHRQGDGVRLPVEQARAAERVGLVRILGASLVASVLALGLYSLFQFGLLH